MPDQRGQDDWHLTHKAQQYGATPATLARQQAEYTPDKGGDES